MTRPSLATLALLAAAPALAAPPPTAPCLTRSEAAAIVSVVAPAAVTATARRCRPSLTANGYLARSGDTLAARLRPASIAALPAARAAFGRIAGFPFPAGIDDATVIGLIEGTVGEELVARLKPADCAGIDRLLEQADPLPPRNLAGLVATIVELGGLDRQAPFRICSASAK